MDEILKYIQYLPYALPFLAYLVVAAVISEILERLFAKRMGDPWFLVYPRRAQAMLPILIGIALGLWVFPDPIPAKIGRAMSALYFCFAGVLGIMVYDPLRDFLKRKYGIEIHIPGDDEPPQV